MTAEAKMEPVRTERVTGTFEGIEFQYSPNREDLVRLLAHRFAEYNAAVLATPAVPARPGPPPALSAEDMRLHREEYLRHISSLLGMSRPTALQQECYGAFLDIYTLYMGLYQTLRDEFSRMRLVHRVTVWDHDEMVRRLEAGEKIAGFSWDPVKKEGSVQFGVSRNGVDGRFRELSERQKQLHRTYRLSIESGSYHGEVRPLQPSVQEAPPKTQSAATAPAPSQSELFPVVIPAELAASPAEDQAGALWTQGKAPIGQILRSLASLPQQIPSLDPVQAFVILHETTEIGVVDLYMRGPDRRWFCDGVANYVAWRVIRDLDGADLATRAYDLPSQLARYASLRGEADLRRWPAVENESAEDRRSEVEAARYAFATNAVALMNQRAGEDVLPRLFARIGRTDARQVSIQTVATAWLELTGEPLSRIVATAVYGADTPQVPDDSGLGQIAPAATAGQSVSSGFRLNCTFNKETDAVTKAVVDAVDRGSPADRAGLKVGDRVIEVSGQRLAGMKLPEIRRALVVQLTAGEIGTQQLRIQRGLFRKELTLTVELKEPEPAKP